MKRLFILILAALLCAALFGCTADQPGGHQIAATTLPVYEFTSRLCQSTDVKVSRLITESVSCLHDYTLQVDQMRTIDAAELIVISGAELEEFLEDALTSANTVIDASSGIQLICHEEPHSHEDQHGHSHEHDPHIWLAPANAKIMSENIYNGLIAAYPQYAAIFAKNLTQLNAEFDSLSAYADSQLSSLSSRDLITFHDGFAYMAGAFDLNILHAIEEESGSEASAAELIALTKMVQEHHLEAIFVECNGSSSAASVISAETGVSVFSLDMAMAGDSYFDAMYYNINTIKEALE